MLSDALGARVVVFLTVITAQGATVIRWECLGHKWSLTQSSTKHKQLDQTFKTCQLTGWSI
jgi:hypothetical protein